MASSSMASSAPFADESPYLAADPPHWAARGLAMILLLLFGGGGFYYGGPYVGGGIGGLLLIVLIIYLLMGRR